MLTNAFISNVSGCNNWLLPVSLSVAGLCFLLVIITMVILAVTRQELAAVNRRLDTMKEGYDYLKPRETHNNLKEKNRKTVPTNSSNLTNRNNKGKRKPVLKHSSSDDSGVVDDTSSTPPRHPLGSTTPPSAEELRVARQNTYQEEMGSNNNNVVMDSDNVAMVTNNNSVAMETNKPVYEDLTVHVKHNEHKYQELKHKRKSGSDNVQNYRLHAHAEAKRNSAHRQSNKTYLVPESKNIDQHRTSSRSMKSNASYMSSPECEVESHRHSHAKSKRNSAHRQSNKSYLVPESGALDSHRPSTKSLRSNASSVSAPEYEVLPGDSKESTSVRTRPKYLSIYGSTEDLSSI